MPIVPIVSNDIIRNICYDINVNITNKQIDNASFLIQETLLKDTLTPDYYYSFTGITTGITYNSYDQYVKDNFIDYIVSYGVWKHLIFTLSYQLYPDGLRKRTSDQSDYVEHEDINLLKSYIDNFINNKRQELKRYMIDNSNYYPLYFRSKWGDIPRAHNFIIDKI